MSEFATVYWIRTSEMTDIETQGYVGVSNNVFHREQQHLSSCRREPIGYYKPDMHKALIIGEYVLEEIYSGSIEDCYLLEYELRPNYHIGWNKRCGGKGVPFDVDKYISSAYRRLKYISKKNGCVVKPLWETTQGYLDFEKFYLQGTDNGKYEMSLPTKGVVDETTIKFLTREELIRNSKQSVDFFNDGKLYSQADLAEMLCIDKPNTLTTQIKRNWSFGKIFMKAWNNDKARLNS
jgi:hypothetical protein